MSRFLKPVRTSLAATILFPTLIMAQTGDGTDTPCAVTSGCWHSKPPDTGSPPESAALRAWRRPEGWRGASGSWAKPPDP